MIRNDGEITVPTIYLEPYTKQLAQGRPMNEIMREIVQIRTEQDTRIPFEVSDLMNYGQVKPMLTIRLCDPEQNREYLKDKRLPRVESWRRSTGFRSWRAKRVLPLLLLQIV